MFREFFQHRRAHSCKYILTLAHSLALNSSKNSLWGKELQGWCQLPQHTPEFLYLEPPMCVFFLIYIISGISGIFPSLYMLEAFQTMVTPCWNHLALPFYWSNMASSSIRGSGSSYDTWRWDAQLVSSASEDKRWGERLTLGAIKDLIEDGESIRNNLHQLFVKVGGAVCRSSNRPLVNLCPKPRIR